MEINLLLTATKLQLAPHLTLSEEAGGVRTVKNTTERTYLTVTARQWRVLLLFQEAQTVPRLLETVLEQRLCPALGELYELVLKAVRAASSLSPVRSPPPCLQPTGVSPCAPTNCATPSARCWQSAWC